MDNRTSNGDFCVGLRLNFTLVSYLNAFYCMRKDCIGPGRWLKLRLVWCFILTTVVIVLCIGLGSYFGVPRHCRNCKKLVHVDEV
jgi:hypothetical protein